MLKKLRILLAVIVIVFLTIYLIEIWGALPESVSILSDIQFIPAILGLHFLALAFVLLSTFVFGRVYCSMICPLGISQDIIRRVSNIFRKKKKRNNYRYARAKTFLRWGFVAVFVGLIISGLTVYAGILDPYSAYARIVTHLLKPVYIACNNFIGWASSSTGNYLAIKSDLELISLSALLVSAITLIVVGIIAWMRGRSYCNTVCPVGTVLGVISRYSLFRVRIDGDKCNSCTLCEKRCKAHCINSKEKYVDADRCVACYNCLTGCKKDAIKYKAEIPFRKKIASLVDETENQQGPADASRRKFLMAATATVVAVPRIIASSRADTIMELVSEGEKPLREKAVSPPGSKSHTNLKNRCTACHLCVNRCPEKIIKPAFLEYGASGILQPVLSFDKGHCDFDCNICSQVCPTGAIKAVTLEEKQNTKIGTARFIKSNCIEITHSLDCLVCVEKCPTEAIGYTETEEGKAIPYVDESRCIGCGACENICPGSPYKAFIVEGTTHHRLI